MKSVKVVLKIIWEFLLGLAVLLILPAVVFLVAVKSIPCALGIMTLLILLGIIVMLNKFQPLLQKQSKKEFFQMFNIQNN